MRSPVARFLVNDVPQVSRGTSFALTLRSERDKINRMPTPSFVHLRLHSEYSVSDGIVRLDDAVGTAIADGMPALALTDLANMFGMVKFYQEARGKGLKPVIGGDIWIENATDRDKPHRLL